MSHKNVAFLIHRQQPPRLIWLISYSISLTSARIVLRRRRAFCVASAHPASRDDAHDLHRKWAATILQRDFRIGAPIASTIGRGSRIRGVGMTERQERLAKEREEIAMRVANFKATQERFEREREEYFVTTLENARSGFERRPIWS
jgi:hypothetical protein